MEQMVNRICKYVKISIFNISVHHKHFLTSSILLVVAGLLLTCSVENAIDNPEPKPPVKTTLDAKIYIVPTMMKVAATKGIPIDTVASMTDFGFFCSYTDAASWAAGTSTCNRMFNRKMIRGPFDPNVVLWNYDTPPPPVEWAAASAASQFSFFGYAPYATGLYSVGTPTGNGIELLTTASSTGVPRLRYTVPAKVENQPDLMWAEPVYNLVQTGHPVPLQMHHGLTAIGFRVKGALNEVVTGLSISGVDMVGSAYITTPVAWALSGTLAATDYSTSIKTNVGGGFRVRTVYDTLITNNSWLMMLPQTLTPNAKVKITLSDGTTREISLMISSTGAINAWDAGKRIWYDIPITPSGATMVIPENVELTYPAHTPAAQTLSVVCLDFGGNPDPTVKWKLTVRDSTNVANQWLTLSPNSGGTNGRYSISGTGPRTVWLVATSNFGSTNLPRSVYLSLDGTTVAATITQYGFPGPNYAGWVYVKQGSNGTGSSWSDAVSTIMAGINTCNLLRSAGHTVHGILVAGGNGRHYNDSPNLTSGANVRLFGGWEGITGTELGNNAGEPYTSVYRDLFRWKAVITPLAGIMVSGAGNVLDGFIVRDMVGNTTLNPCVTVNNGAYIHAVEIRNNGVATTTTPALLANGSNTLAINVLVADNTAPVEITGGAKLVNATIVNNVDGLLNNATVLNTVWWAPTVSLTYTGSNTVQYSAFLYGAVSGSLMGVPAGTGNIALNAVNTAWLTGGNPTPGPHFNLSADPTRVPYMALNNFAPMLGSGNQALFDGNATFLPVGAPKTDIKGQPRHYFVTDMGCYEDGLLQGTTLAVSPSSVWLSGSVGNTTRTIQFYSSGPWTATSPANASLSANSGGAGINTITLTRNTTYGPSSFTITNTLFGGTANVSVDSYYIATEELPIGNQLLTGNTGTYTINVQGGSETFTIVSHSPWITSATILPTGELQLVANQSPDQEPRYGTIVLAHANDPTYTVSFVVHQMWDIIPPFVYLVIKFSWHGSAPDGSGDIDTATEFTNSDIPYSPHFANFPYTAGSGSHKAVGWSLRDGVSLTGASASNTQTQVTDNSTLLIWGGDATGGQGETAFLKAPLITPADPSNDTQNLPRYIYLDFYATWYGGSTTTAPAAAAQGRPVRVTIFTYEGGEMVKPSAQNPASSGVNPPAGHQRLYTQNFYNAVPGTTSAYLGTNANAWSALNPPASTITKSLSCTKVISSSNTNFHANCVRLGTITYDRYRRSATVTWHATEYEYGVTGPVVTPIPVPLY